MLLLLAAFAACGTPTSDSAQSRIVQEEASTRGFAAVPPYIPNEYTAREDINWYLQETEARHT